MSSNSVGRLGHKFSVTRLGEFLKLKLCHKFSCKSSLNIWSLFGQSLLTPFLKKKLLWTLLGQPLEKIGQLFVPLSGHTGLTIAPTHTRLPKACNSISIENRRKSFYLCALYLLASQLRPSCEYFKAFNATFRGGF